MNHTATHHPSSTTGRRRVPAVIAIAVAAGVALAGCSADGGTDATPTPTTAVTTSSSSTPTSLPEVTESTTPVPVATTPSSTVSAAPSTQLPANVVATGAPCHMIGELAQGQDGSPLFCLEDPGGAGPLWLPQPAGTGPDGTGPALLGQPCMQEDAAVTAADGTLLTCRLTGGGDVPGGLFWQF